MSTAVAARRAGVAIKGCGVVTDQFASHANVLAAVQAALPERITALHPGREYNFPGVSTAPVPPLPEGATAGMDGLQTLALQAIHEAWSNGAVATSAPPERIALLFSTAWGTAETTAAYLQSLIEANGRFISPRLFSRSLNASTAAVAAIHFGIHGPCETLGYTNGAVCGLLDRAGILMQQDRADIVITCWADQTTPMTADLSRRVAAAAGLGRGEFARYENAGGQGAVALALRRAERAASGPNGLCVCQVAHAAGLEDRALPQIVSPIRATAWPLDAALHFVAAMAAAAMGAAAKEATAAIHAPEHAPGHARERGSNAPANVTAGLCGPAYAWHEPQRLPREAAAAFAQRRRSTTDAGSETADLRPECRNVNQTANREDNNAALAINLPWSIIITLPQ